MVYIDGITLIGNFLIEAVSCKQFQFEIVKIYQYSKIVNNSLQDTMYSVKFFPANIIEFLERFPEFLHASGNIVLPVQPFLGLSDTCAPIGYWQTCI